MMSERQYVLLLDIVSSSQIMMEPDWKIFQNKFLSAMDEINLTYSRFIIGKLKFLAGDSAGCVLTSIVPIYDIINHISEATYPYKARFSIVYDEIDMLTNNFDISIMGGPAFIKASKLIMNMKDSNDLFKMEISNSLIDDAIGGQISLLLLLKNEWTPREREIIKHYQKVKNQNKTAMYYSITQQAVSKTLKRTMWKLIVDREKRLNEIIESYAYSIKGEGK